jgi:tyrosine-protein kinase Etk/Wzc
LDYLNILWKWRKFISINTLIVMVSAVIISLILPKWYKATASILSPKDQGLLNFFGGTNTIMRGLTTLPKIGGFGQNPGAYNYFAILKSRSALESIVKEFNLMQVYGIGDNSMESTIKTLRGNIAFEFQDDDYITIDVYDKDPNRAAAIANYFVDILNRMSIDLATREAQNNREFIERRLDSTKGNLKKAEELLTRFQERNGIMMTPEQTSTISAFAELYATKAKKEIEIAILERTVTNNNEYLQQFRLELSELDKKLATFPQAGLESIRLYRDVMTEQKILEVLVPLYEQAKINEQKDVPVLLVLDKAIPPERKAKPQRALIILSSTTLFFLFSILLVFMMQAIIRQRETLKTVERKIQRYVFKIASIYRIDLTS